MVASNLNNNYRNNDSHPKEFFNEFRKKYSYKELEIKGKTWRYLSSGSDEALLVLLHGGFSDSYFFFHQIPVFEKDYRVLVPTIPEDMRSLNEIVDALKTLISSENSQQVPVILLGISFGGIIAQVFFQQDSEMLDAVILSHTGPPQYWRQKRFIFMKYFYKILPYPLITRLAKRIGRKHDSFKTSKWVKVNYYYFNELAEKYLTKKMFLSRLHLILDFRGYELDSSIVRKWNGKMLILASEDDRLSRHMSYMKSCYEGADSHIFPSGRGGHHTLLYFPQEYNNQVVSFLKDNNL